MIALDILLIITAVLIAVSLIFSTVKLGISPMPSSSKAYKAIQALVDETGTEAIIDLGSGWGNLVIPLAQHRPQRQVIGYELSWLPWLISTLLKKALRLENLTLHRANFLHAKLPAASVLICYLYPEAMVKIAAKLQREQPDINFLISNNFALPASKPDRTIALNDFYKSPIYLYKLNDLESAR